MRVTNEMMVGSFVRNLMRNASELQRYQEQVSSGHRISKPSDDPHGVATIMRFGARTVESEQYRRNLDEATQRIEFSERALGIVTEMLQRIRELAVLALGGSFTEDETRAIAMEVRELEEQVVLEANARLGDTYLFGGTGGTARPFIGGPGNVQYVGTDSVPLAEVGVGATISTGIAGREAFMEVEGLAGRSLFDLLAEVREAMEEQDRGNQEPLLGNLDSAMDHVVARRAELGARARRLEVVSDRNEEERVRMTELLSRVRDVDVAEAVMGLTTRESVYRASLAVGAQLMQPTLLDYLG